MIEQLREDFKDFKEDCMGILVFGSHAKGGQTKRSDVDVCIVKPSNRILGSIYAKLGGRYDIRVFEKLPLYLKMEVIKNYEVIYGDVVELSAYFYFFRKLWRDMEYRIVENEFKDFEERMQLRRGWINEKEKILREIGNV